jgi:hypothetical protein
MKVQLKEDANVLIPNKEHQNFTESGSVLEEGTILNGDYKEIIGKRRGEPFTYRLFISDKNQIIYQNKTTPMEKTEVTLGADAQATPTKVDMKPAERFTKNKIAGLIIGGLAGFAFAKYKKHDMKKVAMYIGIGAAVGYGAGYILDKRKKVVVQPSK